MNACPYEEAFPNFNTGTVHRDLTRASGSGFPYVGGTDSKATREERRAARKKAKRCKGPVLEYSNLISDSMPAEIDSPGLQGPGTDPDRPAVQRMGPVESMANQRGTYTIPVIPKTGTVYAKEEGVAGIPSYFGAGDDAPEDGEEGYANFRKSMSDTDYMLGGGDGEVGGSGGSGGSASFQGTFSLKGAARPTGALLPEPNLNDSWKPLTGAASYTAYLGELPSSGAAVPGWAADAQRMAPPAGPVEPPMEVRRGHGRPVHAGREQRQEPPFPFPPSVPVVAAGGNQKEDRDALLARIDALTGRLEDLERVKRQDSQTEILMFVGTGLFMLFAFDLMSRR